MNTEVIECLVRLEGQPCWSVIAGRGTGSIVAIDFGPKVKRPRPVSNPYLTPEQREFVGAFSLLISCAWRLDGSKGVVCSWMDENVDGGRMLGGLHQLPGGYVTIVAVAQPAYDLTLTVNQGLTLRLFCDQTEPGSNNYVFFMPDRTLSIGAQSVPEFSEA